MLKIDRLNVNFGGDGNDLKSSSHLKLTITVSYGRANKPQFKLPSFQTLFTHSQVTISHCLTYTQFYLLKNSANLSAFIFYLSYNAENQILNFHKLVKNNLQP